MEQKGGKKKLPYSLLCPKELEILTQVAEHCTYENSAPLFYQGQTPIVSYLLIKGHVQFFENNKLKKVLKKGTIIGLRELVNKEKSVVTARVLPQSHLCFLNLSTILEILEAKGDNPGQRELKKAFDKIIGH